MDPGTWKTTWCKLRNTVTDAHRENAGDTALRICRLYRPLRSWSDFCIQLICCVETDLTSVLSTPPWMPPLFFSCFLMSLPYMMNWESYSGFSFYVHILSALLKKKNQWCITPLWSPALETIWHTTHEPSYWKQLRFPSGSSLPCVPSHLNPLSWLPLIPLPSTWMIPGSWGEERKGSRGDCG